MAESAIRVGVIGAGMIGLQHMDALRRVPGVRLTALAEAFEPRLREVAASGCIPEAYTNWHELVEHVDAVHVCTPNTTHAEICEYALKHGKHVLCEKPLSTDAASAQRLAELARTAGVAACVNQNYRHNVQVYQMRALLARGALGRVLSVRGAYLQDWMLYPTDMNWRADADQGRMRALSDIGLHLLDLILWVLNARVERVLADTAIAYPERIAADGRRVPILTEDSANVLMKLSGGLPVNMTISQTAAGHKNDLWLAVDCEQGGLEWRQERPDELWIMKRDGGNELCRTATELFDVTVRPFNTLGAGHAQGWADAFRNSIARYYADITAGTFCEPDRACNSFENAAYELAVLEAMADSAAKGAWISV